MFLYIRTFTNDNIKNRIKSEIKDPTYSNENEIMEIIE